MENYHASIVEYYSKQRKSLCEYCYTKKSFSAYGLHAYTLTTEDYQNMIDRGWRRCEHYCYKAIMDKTCCPLYTIRCAATDFRLSKTQKKILKRFNNFLLTGSVDKKKCLRNLDMTQPMNVKERSKAGNGDQIKVETSVIPSPVKKVEGSSIVNDINNVKVEESAVKEKSTKSKTNKAKYKRIERKRTKLQKLGLSEDEIAKKLVEKKKYPVTKTLEDYLNMSDSKTPKHNLRISLIRSSPRSEEFNRTYSAAFDVYKRYQMIIHKDPPEKITQRQFDGFLVTSPLQATSIYGSYHQQYWLDDKLIAVGVIDILPKCVSSVYFFYDPEYSYLCLGTYGALREIELTRKLSSRYPDLIFHYMGFYIHTCVKMKYKAAFKPSFLLCPEVYTWHPIQDCLPKFSLKKYSRLNDDPWAVDSNSDISNSDILILYNSTTMTLEYYLKQKYDRDVEEIMEYSRLVGKLCTKKMLLFRN